VPVTSQRLDHLAIPVRDRARSRRFCETYFGFGKRPAKRYDDGVPMLRDPDGYIVEASWEPDS
jgi:hypothetical protein